jgi:hypothetical protein
VPTGAAEPERSCVPLSKSIVIRVDLPWLPHSVGVLCSGHPAGCGCAPYPSILEPRNSRGLLAARLRHRSAAHTQASDAHVLTEHAVRWSNMVQPHHTFRSHRLAVSLRAISQMCPGRTSDLRLRGPCGGSGAPLPHPAASTPAGELWRRRRGTEPPGPAAHTDPQPRLQIIVGVTLRWGVIEVWEQRSYRWGL